MALSGLKENVILTKLYLPQMTPVYVQPWGNTGVKVLTPPRQDHTYQCEMCVPPAIWWGELRAHCGVVAVGILKMESGGVLQGLIQDVGELKT